MNRRSFVTGFGTAGIAALAGCGNNDTSNQTPTTTQTQNITETAANTTQTDESPSEQEIEQLLDALEIRLYLDGYNLLDILRNDGFVGVEYELSVDSRAQQLRDWVGISQSFYGEVMQEGFTPEILQILYAEGGDINIDTGWIDAYQSGSLSIGAFLVNIDQQGQGDLSQRSYYRQAFELDLIRTGFDVQSTEISESEIQIKHRGSGSRSGSTAVC